MDSRDSKNSLLLEYEEWTKRLGSKEAVIKALKGAPLSIKTTLLSFALENPEAYKCYEKLRKAYPNSDFAEFYAMREFVESPAFIIGHPQLPPKPTGLLASPISFNTGLLFIASNNKIERRYRKNEIVVDTPTIQVLCTGEELRRDEYDYYLELIEQSKNGYGEYLEVNIGEFLKNAGKPTGGDNRRRMIESLERMYNTSVTIKLLEKQGEKEIATYHKFHLIEELSYQGMRSLYTGESEKIGKTVRVRMNTKTIKLFGRSQYALLDRDKRNSIKSQTAKLIYDMIGAEKKQPYQVLRLERLAKACGVNLNANSHIMRQFKARIRAALIELLNLKLLQEVRIPTGHKSTNDTKVLVALPGKRIDPKVDKTLGKNEWIRLSSTNEVVLTVEDVPNF